MVSAFGMTSAAAYACDGMKGHDKAQGDSSASQAKKDGKKADTKADQKS